MEKESLVFLREKLLQTCVRRITLQRRGIAAVRWKLAESENKSQTCTATLELKRRNSDAASRERAPYFSPNWKRGKKPLHVFVQIVGVIFKVQ